MATGHTGPRRRERILTAALDLIADEGVAGVSHRRIAARAGVPLGSTTYHFSGMDELLREAFRHFSDRMVALFDAYVPPGSPARHAGQALEPRGPRGRETAGDAGPRGRAQVARRGWR